MLNYHDTATGLLVSRAGQLSGIPGLTMQRGNVPVGVQFCAGNSVVAAPTGTVATWFGLKATDNMEGPWLANGQLAAITGTPGLFQAVLACNTPEMIAAMHADPADPEPAQKQITVYGQFYYFLTGVADPIASQIVSVTVENVLWNGAEGIAPSPNPPYPSSAALNALVTPYQVTDTNGVLLLPTGVRSVAMAIMLVDELDLVLPPARDYQRGETIEFADPSGYVPVAVSVQLAPYYEDPTAFPSGIRDSIDSHAVGEAIDLFVHADPVGKRVVMQSDGVSKWVSVPQAASGSSYTLRAPATNIDKLLLTSVNPGDYAEITGEGGRIEQYLGAVAGALGAGCVVTGAGNDGINGSFGYIDGVRIGLGGNGDYALYGWPGSWIIGTNAAGGGQTHYVSDGSTPFDTAWTVGPDGTGPAPVVTRNDVASDASWLVLRNTVSLTVYPLVSGLSINGVYCMSYTYTTVGWVDPAALIMSDAFGDSASLTSVVIDSVNYYDVVNSPILINGKLFLPFPLPLRCLGVRIELSISSS